MGSRTWMHRRGLLQFWLWGSEQDKPSDRVGYCWLIPARPVLQGPGAAGTGVKWRWECTESTRVSVWKSPCIPHCPACSLATPLLWCALILTEHPQPLHLSSNSLPGLLEGSCPCSAWVRHHPQRAGRRCFLIPEPSPRERRRVKSPDGEEQRGQSPLLSPQQLHRSRAQPGRLSCCSSLPGLEELNSGFAAGSAQPAFAPSCPECTCLYHGRDLWHWGPLAMSYLNAAVPGKNRAWWK